MRRDASTASDVSMRFSDGVPVAPYCFICRRRGADARATDGWLAERGSQREGAQTTAGLAQLLALSPRQRARGQSDNSDAGTCSVDNAAAVLDSRLRLLVSYRPLARFCGASSRGRCLPTRFIVLPSHSCAALAAPGLNETAPRRRAVHLPRVAPCPRLATRARASEPPQLTRHF